SQATDQPMQLVPAVAYRDAPVAPQQRTQEAAPIASTWPSSSVTASTRHRRAVAPAGPLELPVPDPRPPTAAREPRFDGGREARTPRTYRGDDRPLWTSTQSSLHPPKVDEAQTSRGAGPVRASPHSSRATPRVPRPPARREVSYVRTALCGPRHPSSAASPCTAEPRALRVWSASSDQGQESDSAPRGSGSRSRCSHAHGLTPPDLATPAGNQPASTTVA